MRKTESLLAVNANGIERNFMRRQLVVRVQKIVPPWQGLIFFPGVLTKVSLPLSGLAEIEFLPRK